MLKQNRKCDSDKLYLCIYHKLTIVCNQNYLSWEIAFGLELLKERGEEKCCKE